MFVRYILLSFVLAREQVRVVYADDPNIFLSVVTNTKGYKSVRFMDQRRAGNFDSLNIFDVAQQPTKLQTSKGFICGKTSDPGVVTCDIENTYSRFSFVEDNGFINLKTNSSRCLTKMGIDKVTEGFYLNLSPCKHTKNQRFYIRPMEQSTTKIYNNNLKQSPDCISHDDYVRFLDSIDIVEKHLKSMQKYLKRKRKCSK